MSEFDRFLCQCKPRVKEQLAQRLRGLTPTESDFVLRHEDWRIEQFLSLLISVGAEGAMRYLHCYGGRGNTVEGMGATLNLEQIVSQKLADETPYTYLQIATWIANTHKVSLSYALKHRVLSITRNLVKEGSLYVVGGGAEQGKPTVYCVRPCTERLQHAKGS
jgi:hypothetical protein